MANVMWPGGLGCRVQVRRDACRLGRSVDALRPVVRSAPAVDSLLSVVRSDPRSVAPDGTARSRVVIIIITGVPRSQENTPP
jgi:hypothetical protein